MEREQAVTDRMAHADAQLADRRDNAARPEQSVDPGRENQWNDGTFAAGSPGDSGAERSLQIKWSIQPLIRRLFEIAL